MTLFKNITNYFLIIFVANAFTANSQTTITRLLDDFSTLKVYNGIEVELVPSSEQKLVITGLKSESVSVKNTDNTLKLMLPFSLNPSKNLAKNDVSVTLYYNKNIDVLDANEGSTITSKKINQQKLSLNAQEKAFIHLSIDVSYLEIKATSAGVIKLSGNTKYQDVDLDLYGVYNGFDLQCTTNTTVTAGTGAKAEVNAGETLNAKVSFGGSIFYKGNPEVIKDKKVIGGIIQKRN